MSDPKEEIIQAFADQGNAEWQYAGTDAWEGTKLEAKTKLAQIEFRNIDHAENGKPYSRYFTDASEVEKFTGPDGKIDMAGLSERLQVKVHDGQYNASVSIYETKADIEVPNAKVSDNPAFGKGGANQYFFPADVKEGGYLEKIDHLEGVNRTPRLPIFDELKGLDAELDGDEITKVIKSYNESYIDALKETGNPKALEVADDMIERQAFSETARDIKGDSEAIRNVDLPEANATSLDLDSKTLSQVEAIRDASLGNTPYTRGAMSEADTRYADDVLSDPKVKGFSVDPELETQHYYSKAQNAVVTIDKDGTMSLERGTAERPAGHIFHDRLQEAAERFPDFHEGRLPARIPGGVSGVAEAVADMNKTGVWKTLGNVAEDGGKFLGKASKILGPVGVGAATYEAGILEAKAREFQEYGALSEDAVTQYDLILVGHVGQATVDPTMIGGEALTKTAFETWANHHEISDEMKTELAPGLLIDLVGKAGQAIYDTYDDIKGYGEDLAREVTEGLEDIVGMPNHRDFMDDMDPYHAPSNSFKDFLGIPRFNPSFGSGSWQEGALQLNGQGQEQPLGGASIQHASLSEASISEHSGTVSFEDAIGMLAADQKTLNSSAVEGQTSPVQDALNHPDAAHMFQNLHTNGITTLKADITPDMTAEDRVGELLLAGREATILAGIPMPEEERELEATQELNNSYEDDYSLGV